MDRQFPRHEGGQAISNFLAKKGFTLLEAVVAMGILGIAFGVIMTIFTQVVQNTNRAQMANEIRANAVWALNQMAMEIQAGERLPVGFTVSSDCSVTAGSLNLLDSEGNNIFCFSLDPTGVLTCDGLIRDNGCDGSGAFLTSNLVDITNLSFCRVSENKIRINMTVEQCHQAAGTRPEYRGEIDLVEEVALRNYAEYQ